jgi:hypothetical protein
MKVEIIEHPLSGAPAGAIIPALGGRDPKSARKRVRSSSSVGLLFIA